MGRQSTAAHPRYCRQNICVDQGRAHQLALDMAVSRLDGRPLFAHLVLCDVDIAAGLGMARRLAVKHSELRFCFASPPCSYLGQHSNCHQSFQMTLMLGVWVTVGKLPDGK